MSLSRFKVLFEFENGVKVYGELSKIYAPNTVNKLINRLPLDGRVESKDGWLYFIIDHRLSPEKPRRTCEPGWIAYWPLGKAICLFYRSVRLSSPVNRIGDLSSGFEVLAEIPSGTRVRVRTV